MKKFWVAAAIIAALGLGLILGGLMGNKDTNTNQAPQYAQAAFTDGATKIWLRPYTGMGSGVLASGTILQLNHGDQYSNPGDIVGHINGLAGTWVLEEE